MWYRENDDAGTLGVSTGDLCSVYNWNIYWCAWFVDSEYNTVMIKASCKSARLYMSTNHIQGF